LTNTLKMGGLKEENKLNTMKELEAIS
jgi:hypothetical protein